MNVLRVLCGVGLPAEKNREPQREQGEDGANKAEHAVD